MYIATGFVTLVHSYIQVTARLIGYILFVRALGVSMWTQGLFQCLTLTRSVEFLFSVKRSTSHVNNFAKTNDTPQIHICFAVPKKCRLQRSGNYYEVRMYNNLNSGSSFVFITKFELVLEQWNDTCIMCEIYPRLID